MAAPMVAPRPDGVRNEIPKGGRGGSGEKAGEGGLQVLREGVRLPGVEQALPAGETLLWQGRPELGAVAFRVLHLRALVGYWAVVTLVLLGLGAVEGRPLLADLAWMVVVAGVGTALILAWAWAIRATTTYALTHRRVVLRIGIALPVVLNLPLDRIASVDLRTFGGDVGDVVLTPSGGERFGWLLLWPHVRPWNLRDPLPSLRGIPEAEEVGRAVAQEAAREVARNQVRAETRNETRRTVAPVPGSPKGADLRARESSS
jgi:hypothetical protein